MGLGINWVPVPAGTPARACRSCGRTVYWIVTAKGSKMPVDCTGPEAILPTTGVAGRGISHFATCPNANQHRRPR